MSAADRQRAYRQRLKREVMAARVDIGGDVLTALSYRGWTKDNRKIADAELRRLLTRALEEWARSTCPFV